MKQFGATTAVIRIRIIVKKEEQTGQPAALFWGAQITDAGTIFAVALLATMVVWSRWSFEIARTKYQP